jgi:hypothetical protein
VLTNAGVTNPELTITDWVGYGRLLILKQMPGLADKWKLLTVPVNESNWNLTQR